MNSVNQTNLPALVLLCCAAAGIAHAKSVDFTPDITSGDYWDTHHIAAMRVVAVQEDDGLPYSVTYQVETRISDGAIESIRTVPRSQLWFGPDEEAPPPIAVDDRFVIYYAREGRSAIAVTPLAPAANGARLLATLNHISHLRENSGDLQAYLDAVLAADPSVARYSLRHLLAQTPTPAANEDYIAKLIQLRNDDSRETQDRILAGRLANRLQGAGDGSDGEYAWLQTSLAGSPNKQWASLKPLVDRLLEFPKKRPETVAFLAQLATDSAVAQPIRIAAYGGFADSRLFYFDAPDAESGRIYQACLRMLSDPEPTMRRAGAALTHNITMSVNRMDQPGYLQQSKKALTEALSSETDELAKFHLNYFLKLLAH
jgi:hypothetical protein